ncbi:response regulator transcription factor [Paenibacillus radicis (ex Gao et al. 2016)]|uniref:DNA-binding response regulator n=1 Tax=Paenibacillus radicis (ex Gao et al. 2016) TaxID=1737354 RepID=A0A917HTM9_9BACL|nr:response regulator transcription factor [Paenibacillus radicis (ex Gao et al. 2016)]GGG88558.1 DNA-binding response regulator [Paenibacillus radicis (ex Gao et al. 2016)]
MVAVIVKANRNQVLIVEDDANIRRFISINLINNGFVVSEAASGEESLQRFTEHRPGVVVLDIMLPDADGFEICRQLREREPSVIIVFLTARGQDLDKIKGLEIGADDYIVKPFNPLELVARIKAILRRTETALKPVSSVIGSGPIRMDLNANQVFKHDSMIELTPKEFQLVRTFLEHPDTALSRNELLNLVWGEDFVGDPKTVDVHVRKLREKIEEDSSNPQRIETVWGLGYRWRN